MVRTTELPWLGGMRLKRGWNWTTTFFLLGALSHLSGYIFLQKSILFQTPNVKPSSLPTFDVPKNVLDKETQGPTVTTTPDGVVID